MNYCVLLMGLNYWLESWLIVNCGYLHMFYSMLPKYDKCARNQPLSLCVYNAIFYVSCNNSVESYILNFRRFALHLSAAEPSSSALKAAET